MTYGFVARRLVAVWRINVSAAVVEAVVAEAEGGRWCKESWIYKIAGYYSLHHSCKTVYPYKWLPISCRSVSRSFRSRLIGQQLSDSSRDLSTLTFDLGSHSVCRWCESLSSICLPSLKFVALSVRKIWRTSGLKIMLAWWPGPLTLHHETVARYCPWDGQPSSWCCDDDSFSTYRPTPARPCDL